MKGTMYIHVHSHNLSSHWHIPYRWQPSSQDKLRNAAVTMCDAIDRDLITTLISDSSVGIMIRCPDDIFAGTFVEKQNCKQFRI